MSSTLTRKVCFNSNCKEASDKWRNGWRRRTGEYSQLCHRCACVYEEGKFCESFHSNASGWRCCESCGKKIHCGCIVSFHMFVLLDAGGIECLTCAKKSYILTPNPLWPPPSQFLPSHPERMKDLPLKTWSIKVGSDPITWRRTPGGNDVISTCQRLSAASPEKKQDMSDEILYSGKLRMGQFDMLQNGHTVTNLKEQSVLSLNNARPTIFSKCDSSNSSLAVASSSKIEQDDIIQLSPTLLQPQMLSVPLGKLVGSQYGMDLSETHIREGKVRGDGRSRSQLLPRYRPQITDEELLKISNNSMSIITPLFEKTLSASDAGRIGRLVLPKKCAEAYFPPIAHPEGLPLEVQDMRGKEWAFQFRFWPNNNSRMYVLEGITPCIQSMQLQAGDVVTFSRLEPEGKLVMGGRKASNILASDQGDEATMKGNDALTPEANRAINKYVERVSLNGYVKGKSPSSLTPIYQAANADTGSTCSEILEPKSFTHTKRKGSIVVVKSKRLRVENDGELMLSKDEAQGLMRPPAKIVPSVFVVEGYEFEEFEGTEPVIGRPTIPAIDHSGEKIQWVQCEDCFKWRKVPADALLPSRWICLENVWDLDRTQCSAAEELTVEGLEDIFPTVRKVSSKKKEIAKKDRDSVVAPEGLDTLANLAIQGEDETTPASSMTKSKHPRHRPGCSCIVCVQPPSDKGSKHAQSCDCTVCISTKSHFKTSMERYENRQLNEASESASQNLQCNRLVLQEAAAALRSSDAVNSCPNQNEMNTMICPDDHRLKRPLSSPLKGQIDLNIQPEREEESSPIAEFGSIKQFHPPHPLDKFFMQQISSGSGVTQILTGNQTPQDGIGSVNLIGCVAVDVNNEEN